jgi:hypothetical protein
MVKVMQECTIKSFNIDQEYAWAVVLGMYSDSKKNLMSRCHLYNFELR